MERPKIISSLDAALVSKLEKYAAFAESMCYLFTLADLGLINYDRLIYMALFRKSADRFL